MSKYSVGLRNVGSYQISGTPWVTGSVVRGNAAQGGSTLNGEFKITFPRITKKINIKCVSGTNTNTAMFVGFKSLADQGVTNKAIGVHPAMNYTSTHLVTQAPGSGNPNAKPIGAANSLSVMAYLVPSGREMTINVGVKELFLFTYGHYNSAKSEFKIIASLTEIPTGSMYNLTGAGITHVNVGQT